MEFTLEEDEDIGEFGARMWIVNPAFVVKDWGDTDVTLEVDSKLRQQGHDFRVGYEETPTGTDLIIWLKMKTGDPVKFSISPK